MLDIRLFRENPDRVRQGLVAKRADAAVVDEIIQIDTDRRDLLRRFEAIRNRVKSLSQGIQKAVADRNLAEAKIQIEALKYQSAQEKLAEKEVTKQLGELESKQDSLLLRLPNLPHSSTPVGQSEHDNVTTRVWGEKPHFDFAPKSHWDLGAALGILDLERGAKISGSGFYALKGLGAKLERALVSWMIDTHTGVNGYTEIAPPHLVTRKTMTGTGQLPKMEEDLYRIESEDAFLIPTAEVPVTNLHADEILELAQLPIRYVAFSPCYRREAGASGKENRGISRVHQFHKVEMVHFTLPEESYAAHEELTRHACALLEALGLHYRVVQLCTADLSFAAAKCYDLEVWAPGMDRYLEVSSCSNFEDFQARRANIRFRREAKAKPEFVHTLNGSGLALPRLIIALLENYQNADGTVRIPPVLAPYMGTDRIG